MTILTNWPNPERPGVPMFPERDGIHMFHEAGCEEKMVGIFWSSHHQAWQREKHDCGLGEFLEDVLRDGKYYGPVLTSTQLTELLAGEREKCAREAESHRSKANPHAVAEWDVVQSSTANAIAHAIRNLGDAP